MRIHSLEATAFGPFSGTVVVDFDRLSEAGLFLLSGATGAGKTSVLDAVCFALYGDVPGDRATAKRLRADLAEPEAEPRVTLDATLSGRRFRISRTPAWQRPKRRGTGTTPAQASVTVQERVGGAWTTLATRLDEAGLLVSGLVGMNLTQFTQVAMLPQGRFQTFLRAKSEDRHRLLHQLFRTGRFESVESWLAERRRGLSRELQSAHRDLADLVSRTSEAVGSPLPDDWDIQELTRPALDGSLATWAAELVTSAHDESLRSRETAEAAKVAEAEARAAHESGRALATRRAVVVAAAAEQTLLSEQADAVALARDEVSAAGRAAGVTPVARLVARAAGSLSAAASAATALEVTETDRDALVAEEAAAVDAAATVRAALPRERALSELTVAIGTADERLGAVADQRAATTAALAGAARLGEIAVLTDVLDQRIASGLACVRLGQELEAARTLRLDLREVVQARRDDLFGVRQARIEGMAAELAGALAVGDSCPVCGSADHPHKAVAATHAPDGEAERAAQQLLDDANAHEHAHASHVHDLTTQLASARERAGETPLDELRGSLGALREEAAGLVARLDGADPDTALLTARIGELDRERAALEERLRLARTERETTAADLADLLGDRGDVADLATLVEHHQAHARAARRSLRALDDLLAAQEGHTEAVAALDAAVVAGGFDTAETAIAAARSPEEVAALTRQLRDHDRRTAAVEPVLSAPDVEAVLAAAEPDLVALQSAHAEALDARTTASAVAERWADRAARLEELVASLAGALDHWRPLHDEWRLTADLSAFCEGRSSDNRLQMRLSAYVLAYRLSQVVAAANERLARMSDQRYALEHTGRAGAGETRGGLSLAVRDDWSGEARDPATLSGGETFVVSLALALGLADVITHEAGGADLDTLFVDEGFGSLDADTLDDVLDTLDALRDGGRVVGVVSHVAEMRDRIPTQLVVTKARGGSTLAVRG